MGQAAKEAGVSKTTINRAIKSGRLSAEKLEDKSYRIDAAELFRVFPKQSYSNINSELPAKVTHSVPQDNPIIKADTLLAEIAGLKALILKLEDQISDLKKQRDDWQDQAKASQRLLIDMRPKTGGIFGLFKRS